MQFIHYAVFGVGWLRKMNFVTQPGVELYKAITNRLHAEAREAGGIEKYAGVDRVCARRRGRPSWRGRVTLHYDRLEWHATPKEGTAAASLRRASAQCVARTRRRVR